GHGMDNDLAGSRVLGPLPGSGMRDEGCAGEQAVQVVVRSRDVSFGEQDERPLGLGDDGDGGLERLAVHAPTVDAERAAAIGEPALESATFEEYVPARHRVK